MHLLANRIGHRASHRYRACDRADSRARERIRERHRIVARETVQLAPALRQDCNFLRELFSALRPHILAAGIIPSQFESRNLVRVHKRYVSRKDCA